MIYSNYFFFGDQDNIWLLNRAVAYGGPASRLQRFQHTIAGGWASATTDFVDVSNKMLMCSHVFPGGNGIIYAVKANNKVGQDSFDSEIRNGSLVRFQYDRDAGTLSAPIKIGVGWDGFQNIFSGGNGRIYAVNSTGQLLWYKHDLVTNQFLPTSGSIVGSGGWDNFIHVFYGGENAGGVIIYAIDAQGRLFWFKHLSPDTGDNCWSAAEIVVQDYNVWKTCAGAFARTEIIGGVEKAVIYRSSATEDKIYYHTLDNWTNPPGGYQFSNAQDAQRSGFQPQNIWFTASSDLQGICWPPSARPGESIAFRVNAPSDYTLSFVKLNGGLPGAAGTAPAFQVMPVPGSPFPKPQGVAVNPVDCFSRGYGHWPLSHTLTIPADWTSGIYGAKCVIGAGGPEKEFIIPFVVKPAQPSRRIAVLANLFTWHAYNDWGGTSVYSFQSPVRLSLERPYWGRNSSEKISDPFPVYVSDHLLRAEMWPLEWLQSTYDGVDVYTDLDLHDGSLDLSLYQAFILTTHPEYWTDQMFDKTRNYLAGGGALLHLGGNSIYRRCVYESGTRTLRFCTDSIFQNSTVGVARDGWQFTDLVDANSRRELDLLGMGTYVGYPSSRVPYVVEPTQAQSNHWALAGVQVTPGVNKQIGPLGYNQINGTNGAAGIESMWSPPYPDYPDLTPLPNTTILAREAGAAPLPAKWAAEMLVCHDRTGKGMIFSVGSVTFGGSLVRDPDLQQIVKNVLARRIVLPR